MYNYDLLENSLAHRHKSVTLNIIIRFVIIIPSHVINSHGYYHFILLHLFYLQRCCCYYCPSAAVVPQVF